MFKYFLKRLIGKIIERIEKYQYSGYIFDEKNDLYKFIDEKDTDILIETDTGFFNSRNIYKTQPYKVYEIVLSDKTIS